MSANPRQYLANDENPYERNNKNKLKILTWLAKWRCSTDRILLNCCGIKTRSGLKLLNSMVSNGLIRKLSPSPIPFLNLYMLTPLGVEQGIFLGLDNFDNYDCNPTHLPQRRLMHDFVVQCAVLELLAEKKIGTDEVIPEWCFNEKFGDADKRPDAIVNSLGNQFSIEMELTQKSSDRIFMAFVASLRAMNDGLFNGVHYYFIHQKLFDLYVAKYQEAEWPVYKFNEKSRNRTVNTGSIIKPDSFPELVNQFSFHIIRPNLSFSKSLNFI